MPHGDKKTPAARKETDASLRAERAKTDRELASRRGKAEGDADAVLRTARHRADAVLAASRRHEDQKTGGRATGRASDERTREDAAIAEQRNVADVTLEAERVQGQIALASLLAAERHETDSRLLIERVGADEALAHRDDFLAILSHDLRSLLSSVALNAVLIERNVQRDPARVARSAASIQRTTAQMTRLVADLLDIATLDAGKLVLVRGRYDAGVLARQVAEAFEPVASEGGLSLAVAVADGDLLGDFDPDRIAQVLGNLLGNAAKFTARGGRVTIGVALQGRDLRFSVADTGQGIPPENLEEIFDRYAQVGRSDRRGLGLGLGLYISKRIVEAHGGRLWAESVWGQGSTFFFSVPAHG